MSDQRSATQTLSGWGRNTWATCQVYRPAKYRQLQAIAPTCIARGQGRSYGDAAINAQQPVILTTQLNRLLAFDRTQGTLTAEAGTTLYEILNVIVPAGWFLPVTPGTQYATLGGCVACDIHGKNHHQNGSIGHHILALTVITATGETIDCHPTQHADLFWATIGGMGLTGLIGTITLQLMPIASANLAVQSLPQMSLTAILQQFDQQAAYQVAWLDNFDRNLRGVFFAAHHVDTATINKPSHTIDSQWPLKWAARLLQKTVVRQYNLYYWHRHKNATKIMHYETFCYPLDHITHWPLLYGRRGFVQLQCVLPLASATTIIPLLMTTIQRQHHAIFLSVLKRLGAKNLGLLSFATTGFTLALDIPFQGTTTIDLLTICHAIIADYGGSVYLAKDHYLTPTLFRRMYPDYQQWLAVKQKWDPHNHFQSNLSRRLGMIY